MWWVSHAADAWSGNGSWGDGPQWALGRVPCPPDTISIGATRNSVLSLSERVVAGALRFASPGSGIDISRGGGIRLLTRLEVFAAAKHLHDSNFSACEPIGWGRLNLIVLFILFVSYVGSCSVALIMESFDPFVNLESPHVFLFFS
jgi:hypothetical protein